MNIEYRDKDFLINCGSDEIEVNVEYCAGFDNAEYYFEIETVTYDGVEYKLSVFQIEQIMNHVRNLYVDDQFDELVSDFYEPNYKDYIFNKEQRMELLKDFGAKLGLFVTKGKFSLIFMSNKQPFESYVFKKEELNVLINELIEIEREMK